MSYLVLHELRRVMEHLATIKAYAEMKVKSVAEAESRLAVIATHCRELLSETEANLASV